MPPIDTLTYYCNIRNSSRHSVIAEAFAEGNLYFNVRRQIITEAKFS